jgi:hypothetical protein
VQFTRVGGGGFKCCFDVNIVVSCEIDISICGAANIALAISSLAAKTTALTTQVATATASSGTYGFSTIYRIRDIKIFMISVRLSIAGILAREDIKILSDITTQDHTQLTGSLIAATDTSDKDGNDNGQLSLATNSLSASSLNTTSNNKSSSIGFDIALSNNNPDRVLLYRY